MIDCLILVLFEMLSFDFVNMLYWCGSDLLMEIFGVLDDLFVWCCE